VIAPIHNGAADRFNHTAKSRRCRDGALIVIAATHITRAGPFCSYGYISKIHNCASSILAALGGRYDGLLNGHHTLVTSAITLSITATKSRRCHQHWTVSRLPLIMVMDGQQAAGSYFVECLACANVLDKFGQFLDIGHHQPRLPRHKFPLC
jgi:hypothetical protein